MNKHFIVDPQTGPFANPTKVVEVYYAGEVEPLIAAAREVCAHLDADGIVTSGLAAKVEALRKALP